MKVAVVPERYGAVFSPCASIRLATFLDAIKAERSELRVRYLLVEELDAYEPDVVIWHRVSLPEVEQVENLSRILVRHGARGIYDIDDNLLDLEGHGEADAYEAMKAAVRLSLEVAHEVWCSTSRLAERVSSETKALVLVMPNALAPAVWPGRATAQESSGSRRLRLLYMGTRTHDADFQFIEEVLSEVERRRPGSFTLTTVGVRARAAMRDPQWLIKLDPPGHVGASYPAFAHWFSSQRQFDLGVAPLIETRFNTSKSNIKVLDYAAVGLPTLASDVPAYADTLVDGVDCLLAENRVDAWADRLLQLHQARAGLASVREGAMRLVSSDVFSHGVEMRRSRLRQDSHA